MKKAQVNQAFIFIFMLVLIASITLISVKLFNKGQVAACEAEKATFRSNLEKFSKSFTDRNTVNTKDLNAPCSYEEVCFLSAIKPEILGDAGQNLNFVVKQYAELRPEERDSNVFLIKNDEAEPLVYISEIDTLEEFPVCIDRAAGRFNIKFSGMGQVVQLSEG